MAKPNIPEHDRAHDVLAAQEFGMGVADPVLHHGPVTLPSDPTGIEEPHDVLAAEEFAMPAPRSGWQAPLQSPLQAPVHRSRARVVVAGAVAFVVVRRALRNRRV
jgi:hypothetical protein